MSTATAPPQADSPGDAGPSPRASATHRSKIVGTVRLARAVLRRDRLRIGLWVAGIVALILLSAVSVDAVYTTPESLYGYAAVIGDNPASVAMSGPGYGFEQPTTGVVLANEVALWAAIGLGLMSIFLLVRNSRGDEEEGRTELVRSNVVGRHAPLAAAVAVVVLTNLVIAGLLAVGLIALGFDAAGSVALAAASAGAGLVFTGVAAVAAQIASSARGALAGASAALGAAFVVRAVGDVGSGTLTWLSPIGWAQAVRSFADERWWTVALAVAVAVALGVLAFVLESHRDYGGGLLPQRGGAPQGASWVAHPVGLALRLQRPTVIAWSVGLFLLGAMFGSIGRDIEKILDGNPDFADILVQSGAASLTDAYWGTAALMLALVGSGFAVASALRLRTEESAGRAEPILATPFSRTAWAAGSLTVTVMGTAVVLGAGGLGVGFGNAVMTGDFDQIPRLVGSALAQMPAVVVLVGLAVVLFGLVPRLVGLAWAALAGAVVVGVLGDLLRVPNWARSLSPFDHQAQVPGESLAPMPLVLLTVVGIASMAVGIWGLRQRDVG